MPLDVAERTPQRQLPAHVRLGLDEVHVLVQGERVQRAAVAAREVAGVVEDAGAAGDPGLALALVVGLDPAGALDLAALVQRLGAALPGGVVEPVDPARRPASRRPCRRSARRACSSRRRGPRRRCRGSRCRRCRSSSRSARSGRSGTPARRRSGPGTRSRRGERRDRPRARAQPYARAGARCRAAPVASRHAPRCARHRLQHGAPARRGRLPRRGADAGLVLQGAAAAGRAPREGRHRQRAGRRRAHRVRRRTRSSSPRTRAARRSSPSPPRRSATPATATRCSRHVHERTGVEIKVLPGEDEARLTFLAVRRWFGWSSGRLAVFDIGGGSLEVAGGDDESPDVAWSLPLGAGRLTREHFADGPPGDKALRKLRKQIRTDIAHDAGTLLRGGAPDHAVATSKTFRSLARICGAAPSSEGPLVRRILPRRRRWTSGSPSCSRWTSTRSPTSRASPATGRTRCVAGALVAVGGDGHLRPRRARDLPVGAARGRHPRPPRPAQRAGLRRRRWPPLFALSSASVYPENTTPRLRVRREAGLRRRRGDGQHRRGQPEHRQGAGRCATTTRSRCARSTRRAC